MIAAPGWMGAAWSQEGEARIDYLSFAQGALPVAVGGDASARSNFEHAVRSIDGDIAGFTYTSLVDPAIDVEFVYELPAVTTFDRFAVPNVRETPSPSQTFVRDVEVSGSATSATEGFVTLAAGVLSTHAGDDEYSELTVERNMPVRWVKVLLRNGIDVQRDRMFLEFSELVGNGTQQSVALETAFGGGWRGRGVAMLLEQDGAVVSGCYDRTGKFDGTVTGRVLRAVGVDTNDGIGSLFVATVGSDGAMIGVRSTNGAPFRLFNGERTEQTAALGCSTPTPPVLGCDSVVHGIHFSFDSADITAESFDVIDELYAGLAREAGRTITIEGHTSSEGSDAYNLDLSQRRAASVRASLVERGIEVDRILATGIGEARPIADNRDENGRSLNRRVEVRCTD